MTPAERHVVLLLGCPEVSKPLRGAGYAPRSFRTLKQLLAKGRQLQTRACVVHARMLQGGSGSVLATLRRELPLTDTVVWAPRGRASLVREVLQDGAKDVVLGSRPEAVIARVASVIEQQKLLPRLYRLKDGQQGSWQFEELISRNRKMWDLFDLCERIAPTEATVLIMGETGTGKELLARAIHRRSQRSGRFVALNCGAVPENLIDTELFGHVKGAFTGAEGTKVGLFRHAEGGTLFLDEVGNISLPAQHRLLRTLQEGTIRPVGGHDEVAVDVRVIAATSVPLDEEVQTGRFREDLLYRLDVIRILVPPLRERPEDIVFLFGHFSKELAEHYHVGRPDVSEAFLDEIESYGWPGNVRQLENFTERMLLSQTGKRLTGRDFGRLMRPFKQGSNRGPPEGGEPAPLCDDEIDLSRPLSEVVSDAVERVERAHIEASLQQHGGRMGRAAEQLGLSRRTLLRKLNAYDIDRTSFRSPGSE